MGLKELVKHNWLHGNFTKVTMTFDELKRMSVRQRMYRKRQYKKLKRRDA